ncbi:hypothetical protein C8R43DRAFT_985957 [Mycena crocata]|nr:hypothetical protein C8R43DRAFT_985957 [Mycena crocata]
MERTAWTGLWTYLTKVAGKEVANNCIVRARERAAGRIHPDEVERAIRDGDLPNPNFDNASEWKALVATRPNSPIRPPTVPAPPLGRPPAPPLGRAHAPPLPRATADLPSFNAKFGGTVTSFQQGAILKRRRDSDAGSDSDCDSDDDADVPPRNSGISRTRKRARGSMNAAAATGFHAFGSAATTLGVKNPAFMWSTPAFGGGALGGVPSTFGGGISAFGGATSAFGAGTSTFGGAIPAFGSGLSAKAPPAPPVVSCTSLPHGGAQSSESELPIQKGVKRHSPAQKSPTSRTSPAQKSATRSSRRPMAAGHPRLESLPPLPSPTSSESAFLTAFPTRSTVMA